MSHFLYPQRQDLFPVIRNVSQDELERMFLNSTGFGRQQANLGHVAPRLVFRIVDYRFHEILGHEDA